MLYSDYVNIRQGSASVPRFSHGNTLPLVQIPFGMAAFAPQTAGNSSWFFHPDAHCIEGIRLTHQPSPWIADYGSAVFLPQHGMPAFSADARWSGYRPEEAEFRPYYLHLRLQRYRSDFELTPTERGCFMRISFDEVHDNWFSALPLYGECSYRYVPAENMLYARVTNCRDSYAVNFAMYYVMAFGDGEINADDTLVCSEHGTSAGNSIDGDNTGIHLKLTGNTLHARLASSYIGYEQARVTLRRENEDKDFDKACEEAKNIWEEYLSRVTIKTADTEQMKTFCSCMYRAFLYPHKCYEIDRDGNAVHYAPADGKTHPGVRYTDNGFWDTYRTCYPFYSLVAREEYAEMCEGFVNDYREGGWLPRWLSIGERGCMPSTLSDAVLCDAAVKGILQGDTLKDAYAGMLKHANTDADCDDFGRNGAEEYCKLGYVPIEAHIESVNLTADAAYGDWCIAEMAKILGKKDDAETYAKRAKNYANLFDADSGFMRAKYADGTFRENFNPIAWGLDYTEGSAWQNSFAVPHDIEGLAGLYGGKEKLLAKIDELFAMKPDYDNAGYGGEIHEMTEMAAADFGQCAISNQPSFHIPYIYSALGDVDKTSYWVGRMCREVFSWKNDGFPGDEDNGSMALWYVFSTIGFYPFCPGKKEFVRTKKLAEKVYIMGKEFDADSYTGNTIPYDDIIKAMQ